MVLLLHDSLSRRKRPFEPLEPGKARVYHCGPTVYSQAHIGNFRAFVFADVLRRWLELSGYDVHQVMNLTDVGHLRDDDPERGEDKMAVAAARERLDPWEIARKYIELFFADVDRLRIRRAHEYPRATEYIDEMLAMIERLVEGGHAYRRDGNVYFEVATFPRYGRLSGNTGDDLVAGARVAVLDEKKDPRDFALWKHDPHHIMQWDSPFGRGFPGWHIECSAMSRALLGDELDIHTGGEDNIFPHHECEIAQSEASSGKTFVRYWLHTRFLQVDGGKMSKSIGNLYTVDQLGEMGHPAVAVRLLLLRAHYRQVLNFTLEGLEQAAAAVRRLRLFAADMADRADGAEPGSPPDFVTEAVRRFDQSMDDDLNISGALDGVFSLMTAANRAAVTGADAASALAALERFDEVLGVLAPDADDTATDDDAEIERLIDERDVARADKDWAKADRIRDVLAERGVEVLDGKSGARWRRTGLAES